MDIKDTKDTKSQDFLERLSESIPELSRGQRQIARFIIDNYDKAAYMTATALGNEAGVSESTVVRFANELGFEGYPALQAKYARPFVCV